MDTIEIYTPYNDLFDTEEEIDREELEQDIKDGLALPVNYVPRRRRV